MMQTAVLVSLVVLNMLFNTAFFGLAISEQFGWTNLRAQLPPALKWIWIWALALINLGFHVVMLVVLL